MMLIFGNKTARKTSFILFITLYLSSIVWVIIYVSNLQQEVIEKSAVEHARLYLQAISEFRFLYTKEVITKANKLGVKVSHNYLNTTDTIPLPATLSMLLGKKLGSHHNGATTKLYSLYPFPWRQKTGGLRDNFEKQAWVYLNKNPEKPFFQFQEIKGKKILRYAVADVMHASCVNCHNTHPDTPKKGWKLNDVRGVLEVTQPLSLLQFFAVNGLHNVTILLSLIAIISILGVLFIIYYFNQNEYYLTSVIQKRTKEIIIQETEKQEVKKQLFQSQKMESIGTMAGGIAHDFNNLLAGALNNIELLKISIKGQKGPIKYVYSLEKVYERASELVNALLGFARKGKYKSEKINVNQTILKTCVILNRILSKEIHLKTRLANNLHDVYGSSSQIMQVLTNISMNASQSMLKGGEIEIETKNILSLDVKILHNIQLPSSEYVLISITDTGEGIEEKNIERIFEPFFTTKDIGKGTGLGLAAVYGIVENHNGVVTVTSEIGVGSVFYIFLPAYKKPNRDD